MRASVHIFALTVGWLAWGAAPAWSQVAEPPRLDALWEAYQALDYEKAQALAQTALAAFEAPEDLAQVHVVLGLIAFSQNDQRTATRQFTDALVLDPAVELDALLVSPKAMDFFNDIRTGLAQAGRAESLPAETAPRYILVQDRRAEAALRSMVLPGWGQLYKGQRAKGRLLIGVWGVAVAGTVTSHILRQQSFDTYIEAGPEDVEQRYDTFNRWHKTRNTLVLGAIAVWVYSYLDALIAGGQALGQRNLLVPLTFSDRQMHVIVRVQF